MRKIIRILRLPLILFFLALEVQGEAPAKLPRYPLLTEWQGKVWVTDSRGKRTALRKKVVLRARGEIQTEANSQVRVQLDSSRSFTLKGDTRISFPSIGYEDGETPVIKLHRGQMTWRDTSEEEARYNVAVSSDLFEFILPSGVYSLWIKPDLAQAGVKVFEGKFEFSALNGEESVSVGAGNQASFQGILEGGEISYDVLLKGKKIPRGQLSLANPLAKEELTLALKEELLMKKKAEVQKKAEIADRKKIESEGFICMNPKAKFNECAWICLNNPKIEKKSCLFDKGATCVRRRCNASGEWADEIELSGERSSNTCRAQPVVAPCDY